MVVTSKSSGEGTLLVPAHPILKTGVMNDTGVFILFSLSRFLSHSLLLIDYCRGTLIGAAGDAGPCLAIIRSRSNAHDLLEGLPELRVEDGVDYWIDETVHVSKPCGELEGDESRAAVALHLGANCIQHVAAEEGHPAHQEHA